MDNFRDKIKDGEKYEQLVIKFLEKKNINVYNHTSNDYSHIFDGMFILKNSTYFYEVKSRDPLRKNNHFTITKSSIGEINDFISFNNIPLENFIFFIFNKINHICYYTNIYILQNAILSYEDYKYYYYPINHNKLIPLFRYQFNINISGEIYEV